jgi:hypothetical protein
MCKPRHEAYITSIDWHCKCTVHAYVVMFVRVCSFYEEKGIFALFYRLLIYLLSLEIQSSKGEGWNIINGWTPSHVYACSKPEPGFLLLLPVMFIPQCIIEPCHMSWYLLCSVKIRGDCSFFFKLWNWWNWLPSLFKLFFHN